MNNHPRDFDRRTLSMAVFALSLSLAMTPFLSCVGEEFDLCDVDMASLEGSYYFGWQAHEIRYYNTCFDYGGEDHDRLDPRKTIGHTKTTIELLP